MEFVKYFFVAYLFMLSPGPTMALITTSAAKFGIRKTGFIILGVLTSISCYTLLAIVGIQALIELYPKAFKAFKFIGSLYIIYIGIKIFLASFYVQEILKSGGKHIEKTNFKKYISGFTVDILNPVNVIGLTSIILGFVKLTDEPSKKILFFIVTLIASVCYAYTYTFLFGNKVSRAFILPKISLFERFAGVAVSIIGILFLINTIKL